MKKEIKKNLLFLSFIGINVIFIFLQIHKQSNIIKSNYEKQKLENEKLELIQKKKWTQSRILFIKKPKHYKKFCYEQTKYAKIKTQSN